VVEFTVLIARDESVPTAEEDERWKRRAEKRKRRARKRRAVQKETGAVLAVKQQDVLHAVSAHERPTGSSGEPRRTDGIMYEGDIEMPEPSCEFREARNRCA